jgi:hypothetical protein
MKNSSFSLSFYFILTVSITTAFTLTGCKTVNKNPVVKKISTIVNKDLYPEDDLPGTTVIDRSATIEEVQKKAAERKALADKKAKDIVDRNAKDKISCPIYQYEDDYRISKIFLRHDGKYSVDSYENIRGKWNKANNVMRLTSNNGAISLYQYHNKKGDYIAIRGSLGYLIRKN